MSADSLGHIMGAPQRAKNLQLLLITVKRGKDDSGQTNLRLWRRCWLWGLVVLLRAINCK